MNVIKSEDINNDLPKISNNNFLLDNDDTKTEYGILQDINNDIYFYSPITQRSCFELKNKINELDMKSTIMHVQYKIDPPPIHLHIQSNGGSLFHTLYIVDLIKNLNTPVYTYVDGFAASAATLISVVGKKRFITKNSLMLVHQLSGSDSGKFDELEDQMTNMKVLMYAIKMIYLNNTNINPFQLNNLLKKDLWLNAEICLLYGLVDEII
jgi:ATP-dependent protease ClpP protease subunit